jgi:hypothetical protein
MLREGPLLLDAVDRDAYVPRRRVETRLLDASESIGGTLLSGPGGSGRSTMLNWLAQRLRDDGVATARVDARPVTTLVELLDQLEHAISNGPVDPVPPLSDSALVQSQERVRGLARLPRTVVLLDNLGARDVIRQFFGALRDLVWETRHSWIVTAHVNERARFLTPPADSFFVNRIEIPPLSDEEFQALIDRRPPGLKPVRVDEPAYPGPVIRGLLHPDWSPASTDETERELGRQSATVFDHVLTLGRPVGADDQELVTRAGITPTSLRRHLSRLEEAGYLVRVDDREGRPGRPRTLYLPAGMGVER